MSASKGTASTEQPGEQPADLRGSSLPRSFFERCPKLVAPELLGLVLAARVGEHWLSGRIVEVEAYLGPHNTPPDPASHSFRGPTPRNHALFGPSGHAYVYSIYGQYFCMNVSCEREGLAGCVLIRALEPLSGLTEMARLRKLPSNATPQELTSGPSRLCSALGLNRAQHDSLDLLSPDSPLQLREDGFIADQILTTPRIGIKVAIEWPLRYVIANHPNLSGSKKFNQIFSPDLDKIVQTIVN